MNCRQHATMTSVQSIEKGACFSSTYFADDDPVWPMPQDRLQEIVERNCALVSIELSLSGDNMGLSDRELRSILNHQNPVFMRNGIRENIY